MSAGNRLPGIARRTTLEVADAKTSAGENDTSGSTAPPTSIGRHVSASGCSSGPGVSRPPAKGYAYCAARSGGTTAETDAQNIPDVTHKVRADSLGCSAWETGHGSNVTFMSSGGFMSESVAESFHLVTKLFQQSITGGGSQSGSPSGALRLAEE
jgi:hypothetical protein